MKPEPAPDLAADLPASEVQRVRPRVDALLPREMAEKAELIGVDKARLDLISLLALAVLAGAFIGFGSLFSLVALAGAEGALPFGAARVLAGLVFSLGLVLVI